MKTKKPKTPKKLPPLNAFEEVKYQKPPVMYRRIDSQITDEAFGKKLASELLHKIRENISHGSRKTVSSK